MHLLNEFSITPSMVTKFQMIADPTCPYCYLGYQTLKNALSKFSEEFIALQHKPFIITKELPANGMPWDDYLFSRYGEQKAIAEALVPAQKFADSENIPLDFGKIKTMPNTNDALRLLHIARSTDQDIALFDALSTAFFTEGLDIGQRDVLLEIASNFGFEAQVINYMLSEDKGTFEVQAEITETIKMGINIAPSYLIGNTYVVSGIQTQIFWQNVLSEIELKGRELAKKIIH